MQLANDTLIKQIEELATLLSPWNDQLVIGGGVALVLYDLILSKANAGAVGTTDIDFLIPRKPVKAGDRKISELLVSHGYEPKNKSLDIPSVQSFTKQIEETEIEIEFLTDNKSRNQEDVVVISDAGVHAQSLSYIEMSLNEAMPLKLQNGKTIYIVKPEAWVFHKGLTFTKRVSSLKKYKDLYGIWFALTQLSDTSFAIQKALPNLMKNNHPSWSEKFKDNLSEWMNSASPKDWDLIQQQDVAGRLTKASFEQSLKIVIS